MPKLQDLTKKEWSRIKKDAGIEKNKKILKQDANVGKYVAGVEKTRSAWKSAQTSRNLAAYFTALQKLEKAFADFEKTKDLEKEEAATLKRELGGWKTEITKKVEKLVKLNEKFDAVYKMNDKTQVNGILSDCGLPGFK